MNKSFTIFWLVFSSFCLATYMITQLKRPSHCQFMVQDNETHFVWTNSAPERKTLVSSQHEVKHPFSRTALYLLFKILLTWCIILSCMCSLTYHSFHLFHAHHCQMFTWEALQKALFVVYSYTKA